MLTINFYFSIFLVGIIAFFAILVTRFICVSIPTLFVNIKLRKFYWRENILMSWGGMRGGISIALALSITSSASQFIIPLTYAVVILSIVIQGLSFKRVSTKLFPN
jgi:CPA1 family monovalent cation:H+ antiporter